MTSSGVDTEALTDTDSGGRFWDLLRRRFLLLTGRLWKYKMRKNSRFLFFFLHLLFYVLVAVLIPPVCPVSDVRI